MHEKCTMWRRGSRATMMYGAVRMRLVSRPYACALHVEEMADELEELCEFLSPSARLDLKSTALDYVLGLTGSPEGLRLLGKHPRLLRQLSELARDSSQPVVCRDAHLALLNASADPELVETLVTLDAVPRLLERMVDPDWKEADKICMILSNLTRGESGSLAVSRVLAGSGGSSMSLNKLVDVFGRVGYSKHANYDYLATFFSNVSQLAVVREMFLDRKKCIVPRLLPYTQSPSLTRRGGIAGLLRNLCFEVDSHQWLLSEEVDILPSLLLPLAGPEEVSEEEMEKLPVDLQYLPNDKTREEDPDIRKMLLEALTKLCSTEYGRKYQRDKQVYLILRALDSCEKEEAVRRCCLELISILIGEEPELGKRDLDKVEIPPETRQELDRLRETEVVGGVSGESVVGLPAAQTDHS